MYDGQIRKFFMNGLEKEELEIFEVKTLRKILKCLGFSQKL